MLEAVATYSGRTGEKLRRLGLSAAAMQVFLHTNQHNRDPKYANQATVECEPTADSRALIGTAVRALQGIWRPGFRYATAGMILLAIYRVDELPVGDLFASRNPDKSRALMQALDTINERYGHETLRPGGIRQKRPWRMRRQNLSPRYTTRLEDIMPVLI